MNPTKKGTIVSIKQIALGASEVIIKLSEDFYFTPGQYIWLVIPELKYPDPKGNCRAFSICSSPNKNNLIRIVFRSSESGYKKTLLKLPPGSQVAVIGPFGSSYVINNTNKSSVFIAGGVGIAPFLSHLSTNPANIKSLIYFNKSPDTACFLEEIKSICAKNNINLINNIGDFSADTIKNMVPDKDSDYFICGPQGLVNAVYLILKDHGTSFSKMHFEEHYPDPDQAKNEGELYE